MECKYRWNWEPEHGFYIDLDLQWLEGIVNHATREGQIPLLGLEFGNGERFYLGPYHLLTDLDIMYEDAKVCRQDGRCPRVLLKCIQANEVFILRDLEVEEHWWGLMTPEILREVVANCQLEEPRAKRHWREFRERQALRTKR